MPPHRVALIMKRVVLLSNVKHELKEYKINKRFLYALWLLISFRMIVTPI